jgi:sulfite reductase alpha subunit-like flavoprotein
MAEHVAELEPLRIVDLDTTAVVAVCGQLADMAPDVAHAIHTAIRHDASIITPKPKTYPESIRTILLPT